MLSPDEFVRRWGEDEPLSAAPEDRLHGCSLPPDARRFLAEAGLPKSAAPYLTFSLDSDSGLTPVHLIWTCLEEGYSRFRMIGQTGFGDPICLDEANESRVVYLNHDDEFNLVSVNSSVAQLAHCLLLFREFVTRVREAGGDDAFLDGRFPEDCWAWICDQFKAVDDPALDEGAFWATELHIYD
jgi:hypothetical protein